MKLTQGPIIRLILLGLVGGVLQLTTVSQLAILGSAVDISPLLVAGVGLLGGPIAGACFGFTLGLFADTALLYTLGVSSLSLSIVGYTAGRWRSLRDSQSAMMVVGLGVVSTMIAVVAFAILQFLLGVAAPVSWLLLRHVLLLVFINAVLALPIFGLIKRIMRPSLIEDTRRRRRRSRHSSSTPPLSPLTSELK